MTMTSIERFLAIVTGKQPDYLPVFPMLNEQGAKELGISEHEYLKNPSHLAEGQMALVKHFGHDFLLAFTFLAREAMSLGADVVYYKEGSPTIGKPLAHTLEDITALEVPDFHTNPATAEILNQINKLTELSNGEYPIVGIATGPFSLPTLIIGNDAWLTSFITAEPEEIHAALDFSQRFSQTWAQAQLDAGAHTVGLVEGSATSSVIPEDVFIDFVKPNLMKTTQAISSPLLAVGVGGRFEPYLQHIEQAGIAGVVISTDDSLENSLANSKLLIAGNVNNLEFIDYTLDNVEQVAKSTIAQTNKERFIFGTQYVIPTMVKDEVIEHFVKMGRKYGKVAEE